MNDVRPWDSGVTAIPRFLKHFLLFFLMIFSMLLYSLEHCGTNDDFAFIQKIVSFTTV